MTLEHFKNVPNRTKFENRKTAEILVNSVKVAFWAFKTAKLSHFQDINYKYCTHIRRQVFFHIYSVFYSKYVF